MLMYPVSHFSSPPPSGGGGSIPDYSIDFERDSTQYLSMSDTNLGAYDRAKFAISAWVKRESTGTAQAIMSQYGSAGSRAFRFYFTSTDKLAFETSEGGTSLSGRLITTAAYTSTSAWYHVLVWLDSANGTAGDRMRLWVDGTEVTSFGTDAYPSAAVFNSSGDVLVGHEPQQGAYFDGLIYQLGFFSGSLPAIGDVYDSGSPKDISGVTGLYAYLDVASGSVVSDGVLSTDWTNNNTAVNSSTKP